MGSNVFRLEANEAWRIKIIVSVTKDFLWSAMHLKLLLSLAVVRLEYVNNYGKNRYP